MGRNLTQTPPIAGELFTGLAFYDGSFCESCGVECFARWLVNSEFLFMKWFCLQLSCILGFIYKLLTNQIYCCPLIPRWPPVTGIIGWRQLLVLWELLYSGWLVFFHFSHHIIKHQLYGVGGIKFMASVHYQKLVNTINHTKAVAKFYSFLSQPSYEGLMRQDSNCIIIGFFHLHSKIAWDNDELR